MFHVHEPHLLAKQMLPYPKDFEKESFEHLRRYSNFLTWKSDLCLHTGILMCKTKHWVIECVVPSMVKMHGKWLYGQKGPTWTLKLFVMKLQRSIYSFRNVVDGMWFFFPSSGWTLGTGLSDLPLSNKIFCYKLMLLEYLITWVAAILLKKWLRRKLRTSLFSHVSEMRKSYAFPWHGGRSLDLHGENPLVPEVVLTTTTWYPKRLNGWFVHAKSHFQITPSADKTVTFFLPKTPRDERTDTVFYSNLMNTDLCCWIYLFPFSEHKKDFFSPHCEKCKVIM